MPVQEFECASRFMNAESSALPSFVCEPIGLIHTSMQVKFDAPPQPDHSVMQQNRIELFPGKGYEQALSDLAGFDRIWLVWWFDRNTNWRPMVHTPRGDTKRRGVFATRSPHRPNPIGITAVPLLEVKGRTLIVGSVDLLDKTPILDIKPYIAEADCFYVERQGWLSEVIEQGAIEATYQVLLSEIAAGQVEWLEREWQIEFISKVISILERHPVQSRRHRITAPRDGVHRLSSGGWRVYFTVTGKQVLIERVASGFPYELLMKEGREIIPHYQAQIAFSERWPEKSAC